MMVVSCESAIDGSIEAARAAGLRYVSDAAPGIRRRRSGSGFVYTSPDGDRVDDPETLSRIRSLAIPPAWTDVWICLSPRGHLQATGRDARGRKQYRYHAKWRSERDGTKYHRMAAFGRALPRIRERVEADLALPGLPRERVLATVVRLLETTGIRVGNPEYARTNGSYGLTTLRDKHVYINGANVRFAFRGKSGKKHAIDVHDQRLASIVRRCRDIPGYDLFQYVDDAGERRSIGSGDVNDYLRETAGEDFTAKDFRTWTGTVLAACAFRDLEPCASQAEAKRAAVSAIECVAAQLGNTPSVCRKSYIHPSVIESYLDGTLDQRLATPARCDGLTPAEGAVLALLEQEEATSR
jgi:DNA topoisomerase I